MQNQLFDARAVFEKLLLEVSQQFLIANFGIGPQIVEWKIEFLPGKPVPYATHKHAPKPAILPGGEPIGKYLSPINACHIGFRAIGKNGLYQRARFIGLWRHAQAQPRVIIEAHELEPTCVLQRLFFGWREFREFFSSPFLYDCAHELLVVIGEAIPDVLRRYFGAQFFFGKVNTLNGVAL